MVDTSQLISPCSFSGCGPACKYVAWPRTLRSLLLGHHVSDTVKCGLACLGPSKVLKTRGCKDGDMCSHCHLCRALVANRDVKMQPRILVRQCWSFLSSNSYFTTCLVGSLHDIGLILSAAGFHRMIIPSLPSSAFSCFFGVQLPRNIDLVLARSSTTARDPAEVEGLQAVLLQARKV